MTYNPHPMALERLYLFVFVIYCTSVGTVLVMMPWSPAWDQLALYLPFEDPRLLQSSWTKGLLTGFGLVHLIWSVHDLSLVLNPNPPGSHPAAPRLTAEKGAATEGDPEARPAESEP